jgi:hypothetical protein
VPCRGAEEGAKGIQFGKGAHGFPGIVLGGIKRRGPADEEEEARSLGAGAALGVGVDFAVRDGGNLVGVVAIDKIAGVRDDLIRDVAGGKLGIRVVVPR